MLTELDSIIDEYLEKYSKFTIDKINNGQALSDRFINPNFEEGLIKKLFKKDAWLLVAKQIDQKVSSSICPVCSEICLEQSIQFYFYKKWHHFLCAGKKKI